MSKVLDTYRVDFTNMSTTTEDLTMGDLKVEVSPERNNDKSSFVVTDTVYVDVYAAVEEITEAWSNYGTLAFSGTRVINVVEDKLFAYATENTLLFEPENFSYYWIGRYTGPETIVVDGTTIRSSAPVLGVLHVEYSCTISIYAFSGGTVPSYVLFSTASARGNCKINYEDGEPTVLVDVWIDVVDYMSDLSIVGASVSATGPTGTHTGITNNDGLVYLGKLPVGAHYTLLVNSVEHVPSDQDSLENDGFTVPGA